MPARLETLHWLHRLIVGDSELMFLAQVALQQAQAQTAGRAIHPHSAQQKHVPRQSKRAPVHAARWDISIS